MPGGGKCPECGLEIGGDTNVDPYKHAMSCLHLVAGTKEAMIRNATEESPERGRRAAIILGYELTPASSADADQDKA